MKEKKGIREGEQTMTPNTKQVDSPRNDQDNFTVKTCHYVWRKRLLRHQGN